MKAINVSRVSTEEQKEAGNSLPAQVERIENYCKRKSFDVVESFSFDESAYKEKRDEFDKLLEHVQKIATKEKVAVCFDKVDRLSRSVFDKRVGALYEMALNEKIELHFVSDGQVINNQMSAAEKFQFGMSLGLAKYYSDAISDNVKRAYEQKIRNGEWIGKSPIGYMNTLDDKENREIVVDQTRAPFIIKIFEMYASGNASMRTITEKMKELGLKSNMKNPIPLSISKINQILNNPFYYGMMRIKGKLYPHKYPPLISKELFDKVQAVRLGYHKKPFKYASKPYILRGLIKCANPACGCTITAESPKGYIYYSCTNYRGIHNKRAYINENDLIAPIYESLKNIKLSNKDAGDLTKELRKINQLENEFNKQAIENIRKEYDMIEKRISTMFDLRIDGSITTDIYDKKLKEYKEKQYELNNEIQRHTVADESYYLAVNQVIDLSQRALEIFESSEPNEKRQLLNYLLQNCRLDGKKLLFELRKPFDALEEYNKCSKWLRERDSNPRPIG